MEYKMVTIPFDLETAKKINIGERVGQIVTEKGRNRAEIVYEDNSSICPLLVVIHSIYVSADWFSATGKANSSENRLLLEVPEYTTFKDGDVLSNEEGNLMAHYMDELNKAFAYVSASPLSSTWYWSSTESSQAVAWYVVFSSGLTGTGNKHIGDMVRTVIDF